MSNKNPQRRPHQAAKKLYEKTKGMSPRQRDQAILAYKNQVGEEEFVKQMLAFADDTQEELQALSKDTIMLKTKWLNESWVNKSDICARLYGKKDKSTVGYFALQRQGQKPWKPGQLEKLDSIRKELMESLKI